MLVYHQVFLLLGCLIHSSSSYSIVGTKGITKIFRSEKGRFFGLLSPPPNVVALRNVSASFPPGITALCGPSGSGKSTLSKIIAGQYTCDEGTIVDAVDDTDKVSHRCTVYLDPLFYSSYDASKTIESYAALEGLQCTENDQTIQKQDCLKQVLSLPENQSISSLRESQRKLFEIYLALKRCGFQKGQTALVILDEYLDKDMSTVRDSVFTKLRDLCRHERIQFQVLIVTHSKAVANQCDHIVVLRKGAIYNQGESKRVLKNLPAEYVVLP